MEFISDFRQKKTAEEQLQESGRLRHKHPDRLPVLVDRLRRIDPQLDRHKFLVPTDLTFGQFMHVVRKRLANLSEDKALFYFVDDKLMPVSAMMSTVYKEHAQNGYLVVGYTLESTFGAS